MMRLIIIALFSLWIAGCSYLHPYRPDIQQGNLISKKQVAQLKTGMSKKQVTKLMGTPVLQNSFADNRLVYAYQMYPNNGQIRKKLLVLTFQKGRLTKIKKQFSKKPRD